MPYQNPVVVVPGITASHLIDQYPLDGDVVWSMIRHREFPRIALHPDDLRYEAQEPARIAPGRVFGIYDDLIAALRHELSWLADEPTPVFAFPYDWRTDIRDAALSLGEFIAEVLARTKLLKHYRDAPSLAVDLVGHSMGGLVILEYLAQEGRTATAGKVATLGTPFLGSVEAVAKIASGLSSLTGSEPKEREREAARATPSVYQLLPSYEGAAVDVSGHAVDLFDGGNMQSTVVDSLEEFVRLYSVSTGTESRKAHAYEMLETLLKAAQRHRTTVEGFRPRVAGLKRSDWLAVVGIGEPTRSQVVADRRGDAVRYRFDVSADQVGHLDGDGTVHLSSARPPFLPRTHPICVAEDDLGFLELRDRAMASLGGLHATLPRMNLVQRLVVRHLAGERYRAPVWGRRVPGARSWNPPISALSERDPITEDRRTDATRGDPAEHPRRSRRRFE